MLKALSEVEVIKGVSISRAGTPIKLVFFTLDLRHN